jgi:hypothetical protein
MPKHPTTNIVKLTSLCWFALVCGQGAKWLEADKGQLGFVRVDQRKASGWRGLRNIALAIDPVDAWGDASYLRRVTLCYRK